MYKVISLFSGCGGLDLGFKRAGFEIIWANEYDKDIWATYKANHVGVRLDTRDIGDIPLNEVPACDGIIGGPPCQPWSEGGKMLGIVDERGQVFCDYIRVLNAKKPLFFVLENVPGMLQAVHGGILEEFKKMFQMIGYKLTQERLNAANFRVPQDRERLFFVGVRKDLHRFYKFPVSTTSKQVSLREAIGDITEAPRLYKNNELVTYNAERLNHDCYVGEYDSKYMARNRVRSWNERSFTIQALAKNAPIHPQAPKMLFVNSNKRIFVPGKEALYRRLSVRECARIQTFPDSFEFFYSDIRAGYKMVGNAVPVRLAYAIAIAMKSMLDLGGIHEFMVP